MKLPLLNDLIGISIRHIKLISHSILASRSSHRFSATSAAEEYSLLASIVGEGEPVFQPDSTAEHAIQSCMQV